MIIKETSHGVKEISEQMRRHIGANIETLQLTKRLRHTEQTNIDEMQNFLSLAYYAGDNLF